MSPEHNEDSVFDDDSNLILPDDEITPDILPDFPDEDEEVDNYEDSWDDCIDEENSDF